MKTRTLILCLATLFSVASARAATLYVNAASTNPVPPYAGWPTAAAAIQDAVDAALAGDEIVVTNGVYQTGAREIYGMSNRVAVTKAVTVRSVNGPEVTKIVGYQVPTRVNGPSAVRCVYLTNGAVLTGFTLTNGATQDDGDPEIDSVSNSGGGVWCETRDAVVTNCVLAGNSAFSHGGGAFGSTLNHCTLTTNSAPYGAGAAGSTLNNCALTGNSAETGGGTFECALKDCTIIGNRGEFGGGVHSSTLTNCTLSGNSAHVGDGGNGGGAYGSTLENCLITGNRVWGEFSGGGGASECVLINCIVTGNNAGGGGGGGVNGSALNNCALTDNQASLGGGATYSTLTNCLVSGNSGFNYGGGAFMSTLYNCTLTGNSGYAGGGGAAGCTLNNCIAYYNNSYTSGDNYSGGAVNYSCTTPDPGSGVGNITNAPLFVDTNGWSNLRLQSNSPCINAGNNAYVTGNTDLDGHARIVGGTVDMGAFEWQGTTRYVSAASTHPIAPYSSWEFAAVTIQDAVDAAAPGDEIVVTNGVYQTGARAVYGMSNRVAVTKPVTVRSVNGPEVTTILGSGPIGPAAVRCVYLTNGAVLMGFTLANGATQAEFCDQTGSGGGVWCESSNAVVSNCTLRDNSAYRSGGGAYDGTLNGCTLASNSASFYGGGDWGATLNNCTLTDNSAYYYGGGAIAGTLNNCTVAGNSASASGGGTWGAILNNCIVFYNSAPSDPNDYYSIMSYSCTTPDPGSGVGNITNAPRFVDTNGWSNLRLQSNSPCINAGNNAYVTASTDLDGRPRIVGGVVDMGAYEYQGPGTGEFMGWLQQSGLPTDGSADFTDPDADGANNFQEYRGGTNPTNPLSVLRLRAPAPSGSDVAVTWQSVAGVSYALEWSTNLGAVPAFQPLASNLPGQVGLTTFTHTNGAAASARFYRVRVP